MRLTEQVLRAIRWDTLGMLATSGITFLTTVWLVRALGPDRFGGLAALLAGLGLAQLVASGGVRHALLRFVPEAVREGGTPAVTVLVVRAALGRTAMLLAVSLPLVGAPETVATVGFGRPDLAPYVRLLPLLLAPPLYADVLATGLIALFRQPVVRTAQVANKLVFALGLLSLPAWRDPLHGVFAAWVGAWSTEIVWLAAAAAHRGLLAPPRWTALVPAGRWVRFSGAAYALSLIAFALGRELDILLLTRLGTPPEGVARYAVSFGFVTTVLALPLLPIAGGFDVPLIARLYGLRDWEGLRRLFRAFFEYVYLFMLPLIGGGLLLGPSLVRAIYGAPYASGTTVLLALLVLLGLTKLGGITGPFLMATDREGTLLRVRLTAAALNLVAALVAIPRFGALGAAVATGGSMLALVVWEGVLVHRFLRPRYPWGFLVRVAAATGVMMAAVEIARLPVGSHLGLFALLALVGLGALVYLAMLFWLRPVSPEQGEILSNTGIAGLTRVVGWLGRPASPAVVATDRASQG